MSEWDALGLTAYEAKRPLLDRIEELEAERDDYAFKLAEANNTYGEMHVALSDANDKLEKNEALMQAGFAEYERRLAKAVDELQEIASLGRCDFSKVRATLAELKGDK